jgi:peptide-methionine (S)-S-oxide reductase
MEAVFDSLRGVERVTQGWVNISDKNSSFSEAVLVEYDESEIALEILIEVHLLTHSSTSDHLLRDRYKSAIYLYDTDSMQKARSILDEKKLFFSREFITEVHRAGEFKVNDPRYKNYYKNNPQKPFCKSYIEPKLKLIFQRYSKYIR